MRLKLHRLIIEWFKGCHPCEIAFDGETRITGDNGTGKTRILDAYLWLLFGKDSLGQSVFDIKPVGSSKVDVEVEGIFSKDGVNFTLMKVYREDWRKPRGEAETKLVGHTTKYYIDGIDVIKKKYDEYIADIIDVDTFKCFSDPLYFHSLKWELRREMLFNLIEGISDEEIIRENKDFVAFFSELQDRPSSERRKRLQASIREMKKELPLKDAQIKEVYHSKPDPVDTEKIYKQINTLEAEYEKNEKAIRSKFEAHNQEFEKAKAQLQEHQNAHQAIIDYYNEFKSKHTKDTKKEELKLVDLLDQRTHVLRIIDDKNQELKDAKLELDDKKEERQRVVNEWYDVQKEPFTVNENAGICPACKRPLDNIDEVKEKLKDNFEKDKEHRLADINDKGGKLKLRIENLKINVMSLNEALKEKQNILANLDQEIKELRAIIDQPQVDIDELIKEDAKYKKLMKEANDLEGQLSMTTEPDVSDLEDKNSDLENDIEELRAQLRVAERIKEAEDRIEELEKEKRELSQKITDLEKEENMIQMFMKRKIEIIEAQVNSMFKYVQFKLYDYMIGGSEDEVCVTLINGVPYHSANYAGRINAGLDIIRVLSQKEGIYTPVFIDNRESISEIVEMDTQIINLEKITGQTKLEIS